MFAKTLLVGSLATLASAHIKMSSPQPYGSANLNNSPLEADGSDFPCKQRSGVYDSQGASNVYSLGSTGNDLAFVGSAVHGGGSCQVSITYDAEPDSNSVWKVIKSIEGGCPAQDTEGNLGDDANLQVPYKYSFDIPDDIPAGNGTIAWTWFNKVGNREMYMNCGPVTLQGDGGSEEAYNALPDMFVANIGNGCDLTHGTDVEFPDAGDSVDRLNGATDAFAAPNGNCGPTGNPGNPGPAPTGSPAPPTTQAPNPAPTGPPAEEEPTSLPGGIFLPSQEVPEPTAAPEVPDNGDGNDSEPEPQPEPEQPEQPENPDNGEGESPAPPTEGAQQVGSPCSEEGQWNCIGGSSFQRCASGSWSSVMQLASGVTCEPGQGANINMIVSRNGRKRALRKTSAMM